jgi:hypothetical protein
VGCKPRDRTALESYSTLKASGPWPSATVLRPNFFSLYMNNSNNIQTLEICSNSNIIDKFVNSIAIIEFKLNL